MKRLMVDTNVYSNALRGLAGSVALLQRAEEILISPVVLGELYNGFQRGNQEGNNRENLREFLASPRVQITVVSAETSEFYASVLTALKKQGTPIPTNDIWIAANALEYGAHLATADRHFQHIAGLHSIIPMD